MTPIILTLFLPVPPGSGGTSPSSVLQLVFAVVLAAWLLQLVRLAFLVVQWRVQSPADAEASEATCTEIEINHSHALGKL